MSVRITENIEERVRSWHREGLLVEHYIYAPGAIGEMTLHTHADYQICVSLNAPGEYRYRGTRVPVPARSVSIIHPHELHGARDLETRMSHAEFWVFYINADFVQRLFDLKHPPFAERAVTASPKIFAQFAALPNALLSGGVELGKNSHGGDRAKTDRAAHSRRGARIGRDAALPHDAQFGPRTEFNHGVQIGNDMPLGFDTQLGREALLGEALEVFFNESGLRAPDAPPRIAHAKLERARKILEADCTANPTLVELAREVGLSPRTFSREFKLRFGTPPHRFLTQSRVERAKRLLADGVSIAEAAAASGFADQSHLTRHFRAITGFTPGRYFNFGKNVQDAARHAVLRSS